MEHEILIVDDEPDIRFLLEGVLEDEGYVTRGAGNSDEALAAFREGHPSLVILDIWLQNSKLDGIELLKIFKAENPGVPVVMISGHGTIETAVASLQHGAYDFIEKPFQSDRLLVVVRRALEDARLRRENAELRTRAGTEMTLMGNSALMQGVRSQIAKVAPTNSRVLISGGAGAGKEVAARMLHAQSKRADGPFVVLNCATLAPDHFEEELFGVEGRDGQPARRGLLERAHRGTLLLDEVADMPFETQGKIVRALQMRTFERVGGGTSVKVDVRVIASTSRDLQEEIAARRFREDLYYRLAVVPLTMPALRERAEDIPVLARYFLESCAKSAGLPDRELAVDALASLQTYDWPGNVRELRNLMERMLIMAPSLGNGQETIRVDMLPEVIRQGAPSMSRLTAEADVMSLPLREARDLFETQYLQVQLMRFGGNISRTANFVGMERSALHRKLKQLGVTMEDRAALQAAGRTSASSSAAAPAEGKIPS
ncbi:nitrogen assimilation response regulator NtrX [Oecophyllibacter saccharovorans]|uniref:Sigma-54-dependent Fis family transcriptional regulator n=1 Tax=Oecophyllibacter saccharovorans TaxID=2558360 RepID=A0A506ULH5_9PROT|nr:sigma-54 dependent transcriptional regulator [Oecophyllibacter saccharovorans]QDH15368.1 sigma-54-dependent Fis family transcriptional regulator [Oecophyllibacter saccharovorans]TPW34201.1 sigma-54-dependent Fis family transcriptional regulator [Oecophyllibacter saccharovorans]TPW36386.1 sigma-54-dependent Fis family transcriptional regulator [Oecophyllibacter saccharovorans]